MTKSLIARLSKREIDWREKFINKQPANIKPLIPGTKIFIVHGNAVRDLFDSDYIMGGNGYRYYWIPKGEIWLDDSIHDHEIYETLLHESVESMHMAKGDSYDTAHDKAKAVEDSLRHKQLPPGELEPA